MERQEVYKVLDTERDYQEEMTADKTRPDMIEDLHIGDTLSAIEHNLKKARDEWYKGAVPHQEAIMYLRKIAGLCVQAGEKHGMPRRN